MLSPYNPHEILVLMEPMDSQTDSKTRQDKETKRKDRTRDTDLYVVCRVCSVRVSVCVRVWWRSEEEGTKKLCVWKSCSQSYRRGRSFGTQICEARCSNYSTCVVFI